MRSGLSLAGTRRQGKGLIGSFVRLLGLALAILDPAGLRRCAGMQEDAASVGWRQH